MTIAILSWRNPDVILLQPIHNSERCVIRHHLTRAADILPWKIVWGIFSFDWWSSRPSAGQQCTCSCQVDGEYSQRNKKERINGPCLMRNSRHLHKFLSCIPANCQGVMHERNSAVGRVNSIKLPSFPLSLVFFLHLKISICWSSRIENPFSFNLVTIFLLSLLGIFHIWCKWCITTIQSSLYTRSDNECFFGLM